MNDGFYGVPVCKFGISGLSIKSDILACIVMMFFGEGQLRNPYQAVQMDDLLSIRREWKKSWQIPGIQVGRSWQQNIIDFQTNISVNLHRCLLSGSVGVFRKNTCSQLFLGRRNQLGCSRTCLSEVLLTLRSVQNKTAIIRELLCNESARCIINWTFSLSLLQYYT